MKNKLMFFYLILKKTPLHCETSVNLLLLPPSQAHYSSLVREF